MKWQVAATLMVEVLISNSDGPLISFGPYYIHLYLLLLFSMGFDCMENIGVSIVMDRFSSKTFLLSY